MNNMDREVKMSWELLNKKVKKYFINARAKDLNKKYHDLYRIYQVINPVITVGIKDGKNFVRIPEKEEETIITIMKNISEK